MGWYFPIQNAHLVAYLTIQAARPPRVTQSDVWTFLGALQRGDEVTNLISSDPNWVKRTQLVASETMKSLSRLGLNQWNEFLDPEIVARIFADLRTHLSVYKFYCLAVGVAASHDDPLSAFARDCAFASKHNALVLIPDSQDSFAIELIDPLPAFAQIMERPQDWPGMLFWSSRGSFAFAPLEDARALYAELMSASEDIDAVDDVLGKYHSCGAGVQLLHLSDLHFGTTWATENEALLLAELHRIAPQAHRVVITGDLCQNPSREDAIRFRNFRASLKRLTGKESIVVPGNHDQKWLGNAPPTLRQLAQLEWSSLVVDHDIRTVFLCFDSSLDATLANGRVSIDQLRDVGTLFATECAAHPDIASYLRIALIHHHPLSFETKNETLVQRVLAWFGSSEERFLRMQDAESFLKFCAKRGVPLILHGHKHVQRYVTENVDYEIGGRHRSSSITVVGCGASLGAEGKPITYNLLNWDPRTRRWSASFFGSDSDGSGFVRQCVALHAPVDYPPDMQP